MSNAHQRIITRLAIALFLISSVLHLGAAPLPPMTPPPTDDESEEFMRQEGLGSTDLIVYSRTIQKNEGEVTLVGPWVAAAYETGTYIRSRNDAVIDTDAKGTWKFRGESITFTQVHGWTPRTSMTTDEAEFVLGRHQPIFLDDEKVRGIRPMVDAAHLDQSDPRKLLEYIYGEARRGSVTPLAVFMLSSEDTRRDFNEHKNDMLKQLGLEGDDWTIDQVVLEYLWQNMHELLTTTNIQLEPSYKGDHVLNATISHLGGANGFSIEKRDGVWVMD